MIKHFKNHLVAGLLVWLPIALTVWIIKLLLDFVDKIIPQQLLAIKIMGVNIPGFGLIILLIVFLLTGIIAKNILGQSVIKLGNFIILQIPLVKTIYKSIKQVSDTLLASNSKAFRKAVLVKFPHSNSLTIAFITGTPSPKILSNSNGNHSSHDLKEHNDGNLLAINPLNGYINVYVPTTPNPTSGYFLMVQKSDVIELAINIDEALKYVISMGAIEPR